MRPDVRERLELALVETRERVEQYQRDVLRCMGQGLAWDHGTVRTHRARLSSAMIDILIIERLLGGGR